MAACFGPVPVNSGYSASSGKPPRYRRLSSTYRSFRQPAEDEVTPRRNRQRVRSLAPRIDDGYASDTPFSKPFLSTFKSDDHDFENALMGALRVRSRSAQSLVERKPSPLLTPVTVTVPKLHKQHKRTVTFCQPKQPMCKVVPSELPRETFELLKNRANTLHPKLLYSTKRHEDLKLTIIRPNSANAVKSANVLAQAANFSSLNRPKHSKVKECLKRSQSDSDLTKQVQVCGIGAKVDADMAQPSPVPSAGFNKCLRVLNGSWRNIFLLGGMSRPPKAAPLAKKVPPPAVPDVYRHSGSSFGSAGYASSEDGFLPLPPPDGQSNISDGASPGVGGQFSYPSFTFPGKGMYYHQNLQEDQGIDMTQSPGRDSPGSSGSGSGSGSRHSTASLDSGRASGSHLGPRAPGSVLSSSPRCSISSIVSSEHSRIDGLAHQGMSDEDMVQAWLAELHFEEYYPLFANAGYDMPTISKMTPEDLTAIGVKKPNHRKKLKAEIAQLNISDGLPEFIPGSMEEWLRLLRLDEYIGTLKEQNYHTVADVTQLAWEDLEEAGVVKLGHQKRLILAIKRVKDIRTGKRISHNSPLILHTQAELHTPSPAAGESASVASVASAASAATLPRAAPHPWAYGPLNLHSYYSPDIVPIQIRGGRGKSLESLEDGDRAGTHHTFSPETSSTGFYYQQPHTAHAHAHAHTHTTHTAAVPPWRRSYDDGDITPTNECAVPLHEGGGTLPRPRGLVRPRPVAKIPATRSTASHHYFEKPSYNIYDIKDFNSVAEPLKGEENLQKELFELQEKCPPCMPPLSAVYDYKLRYSTIETSRRRPPSPPKRQLSHSGDAGKVGAGVEQTTVVELHSLPTLPTLPMPTYEDASPAAELETLHLSWHNDAADEEQQLLQALAQQTRNGSDASFKSSSSTESDSIPFANENAGTIKQRARTGQAGDGGGAAADGNTQHAAADSADVLSDIGNMLANLTDELDAMLEEEKRQGFAPSKSN